MGYFRSTSSLHQKLANVQMRAYMEKLGVDVQRENDWLLLAPLQSSHSQLLGCLGHGEHEATIGKVTKVDAYPKAESQHTLAVTGPVMAKRCGGKQPWIGQAQIDSSLLLFDPVNGRAK